MTPDARAEQGGRERSPLFVYRYNTIRAGYPWGWVCRECDESQIGYAAHWPAFREAHDHSRTCPALRLARLEAELESEVAWQEKAAKYARDPGWTNDWWLGVADTRLDASRRLAAILARHRQASNGE